MKANELRIGNYIMAGKSQTTVLNIQYSREEDGFLINNSIPESALKGIELTEEWLLKAGLQKIEPNQSFDEDGIELTGYILPETLRIDYNKAMQFWQVHLITVMDKETYCIPGIKFIHQLQNLFYALTGEELTFKP